MSWVYILLQILACISWYILGCNRVGVSGLRREDADTEEAKAYALLMADTVLVTPDAPELLTTAAPRSWKDNAYFFKVPPRRRTRFPAACAVHISAWCAADEE